MENLAFDQRTNTAPLQAVAHSLSGKSSTNKTGFILQDNRPQAAVQRRQVEALATKNQLPVQKKENKTGLPDNLKSGIENLSGYSMDDVKVHYNSAQPAQLNAHAYAQGNQIHVAPGQEKHLPHEAWHVVQQKQGRVKPTTQLKGKTSINDDAGLEKEADVMGKKALYVTQFKGNTLLDLYDGGGPPKTIQRQEVIQRIIVVADKDLDYNQFVGVYQMLRNGIDERVTLLSLLGNSDIRGEQIGLRGHGYGAEGKYAGMEAEALAKILIDAGVNQSNAVIDLLSCKSGGGGDASYAEKFATAMGHSTTVYANRGVGVLMDDGYSYSKRDRTPQEDLEYKAIATDCAAEVERAKAVALEGRALLSRKDLTERDIKAIFMEYGPKVLAVAGTLYARLYEHQAKLIADHDDPRFGLYVSPKQG